MICLLRLLFIYVALLFSAERIFAGSCDKFSKESSLKIFKEIKKAKKKSQEILSFCPSCHNREYDLNSIDKVKLKKIKGSEFFSIFLNGSLLDLSDKYLAQGDSDRVFKSLGNQFCNLDNFPDKIDLWHIDRFQEAYYGFFQNEKIKEAFDKCSQEILDIQYGLASKVLEKEGINRLSMIRRPLSFIEASGNRYNFRILAKENISINIEDVSLKLDSKVLGILRIDIKEIGPIPAKEKELDRLGRVIKEGHPEIKKQNVNIFKLEVFGTLKNELVFINSETGEDSFDVYDILSNNSRRRFSVPVCTVTIESDPK